MFLVWIFVAASKCKSLDDTARAALTCSGSEIKDDGFRSRGVCNVVPARVRHAGAVPGVVRINAV